LIRAAAAPDWFADGTPGARPAWNADIRALRALVCSDLVWLGHTISDRRTSPQDCHGLFSFHVPEALPQQFAQLASSEACAVGWINRSGGGGGGWINGGSGGWINRRSYGGGGAWVNR